ncbi:MAG: hypothetical protein H2049_02450 [Porphyrobacter sp.]|nr:hypothetical protein [Porphyrobacter sp.]
MVWLLRYSPADDRSPDADVVKGNWKQLGQRGQHLELEDYTPDGGGGLQYGLFEHVSGRRVKPEGIPRIVRWKSRRRPHDFEWVIFKSVSDRLRALIEEIDPEIHQFERVEFISRDGNSLEHRWLWQICHRIDTIHRAKTDMVRSGLGWRNNDAIPQSERIGAVFDLSRISDAGFWYDKYLGGGPYCSDNARNKLLESGFSGFTFVPMKSA